MTFTDDECDLYNAFCDKYELSDDEIDCFILLKDGGMRYSTCEKTILEARAKAVAKEPEPEPEPEPVEEPVEE
tara:strand:+ start:4663 stop:4881 length:219 start_codon:yes stop_codon:yes gene_type:complete